LKSSNSATYTPNEGFNLLGVPNKSQKAVIVKDSEVTALDHTGPLLQVSSNKKRAHYSRSIFKRFL